jgi:ferredoxin
LGYFWFERQVSAYFLGLLLLEFNAYNGHFIVINKVSEFSTMMIDHSTLSQARAAALKTSQAFIPTATSLVSYQSNGKLLIIGEASQAIPLAKQLSLYLECAVILPEHSPCDYVQVAAIPIARGKVQKISGYLGCYYVELIVNDQVYNPAILFNGHHESIDLILDLTEPPYLKQEIFPVGYYAPNGNAAVVATLLQELPEMMGQFDKPKFFNYDPNICAHGRSGQVGCTLCLTACPTEAIQSQGEHIAVNPHLCQGAGSCASVCPTGALTYNYPSLADTLNQLRQLLNAFFEHGGEQARVIFYSREKTESMVELMDLLPPYFLPFAVAEIGSVGIELILSTLAYGAEQVILLSDNHTPPMVMDVLSTQLSYIQPLLMAMDYPVAMVKLQPWQNDFIQLSTHLQKTVIFPNIKRVAYAGLNEKRTLLRLAITHLYQQAKQHPSEVTLPQGAPFGEIQVDVARCTLCMACVSQCPCAALSDGGDVPLLKFNESACVQCGLCQASCPEEAITLSARYLFSPELRMTPRIINETQPFHCIDCGKPFATQLMINRMQSKLKDHWMFQGDGIRKLQLCENCRVKVMFNE